MYFKYSNNVTNTNVDPTIYSTKCKKAELKNIMNTR